MSIGSLLKKQRERQCLTQKQVADLAGLQPSYYNRVENGKIKRLREKNRSKLTEVLWPDIKVISGAETSVAPEGIPLEEFLSQVDRILRRGEAARVRERLLPIRDWVNWLHHAWLELEDRHGQPGGDGSQGISK